jgi:hypothetical protein
MCCKLRMKSTETYGNIIIDTLYVSASGLFESFWWAYEDGAEQKWSFRLPN